MSMMVHILCLCDENDGGRLPWKAFETPEQAYDFAMQPAICEALKVLGVRTTILSLYVKEGSPTAINALDHFITTIRDTGGVERGEQDGVVIYMPKGDPEWTDLGQAYVEACRAMGYEALINGSFWKVRDEDLS